MATFIPTRYASPGVPPAPAVSLHQVRSIPSWRGRGWARDLRGPLRIGLAMAFVAVAALLSGDSAEAECIDYGDYIRVVGGMDTPDYAEGLAVSGTHAYVADADSGLQVIDIADPANPRIVGSVDTPGNAASVVISGTYAYVADYGSGLQVIDITDPENPQIVGGVDTPGSAYDVAISGGYAYVADYTSGLQVIDVTNPLSPQIVGGLNTGGYREGIAVSGSCVYLVGGTPDLLVIDVSSPESPHTVGSVNTPDYARDVAVSGSHAYVADDWSGLQVIDITNPASPQIVGSTDTPGNAQGVVVSGTLAYVADGYSLQVIDITDPASPQIVGGVFAWGSRDVVVVPAGFAYVAAAEGGLHVIDITNPEDPPIVGGLATPYSALNVVVSGTHAYVAEGEQGGALEVIDITDPANPQSVGVSPSAAGDADVAVSGGYAYSASGHDGLRVIDITDPADPQMVGAEVTPDFAQGVAVAGDHAYVTASDAGLQVIDITNPVDPQIVGAVDTPGYAFDVAISGTHAFVADADSGLQVIDIADPADPQIVGSVGPLGYARAVAVSGTHAYVAYGYGLGVVDIADPGNPQILGNVKIVGGARGVVVAGSHAYVAGESAGLQVVDVADPHGPWIVGCASMEGAVYGVTASGSHVFVADGWVGLKVVSSQCAPGVCCLAGTCELYTEAECLALAGEWREGVTGCDPNPCVPHLYLVNPDGPGDFPTIQAALNASWLGDTVALGSGTFTGVGNRDLTYHGRGIQVRSVSGDARECVIDCEHEGRGFAFDSGEGEGAWLTGVMIINGQAPLGGGIYCSGSFPQITDCIFLGNAATAGGGGGMCCTADAAPGVSGCVFAWNQAAQGGGGLDCRETSAPFLINCVLDHNISNGEGACLASYDTSHPILDHTILSFGWGGEAVTCDLSVELALACCDVYGNELGDYTGCIAGEASIHGNFSADPLFCGEANPLAYYAVAEDSPCAPENNPCGLVGVAGIGCAMLEVVPGGGGEYETIQAAVDAAGDGDIVLLVGGLFEGEGNRGISMYGRPIIIRTQSRGWRGAVIDCGGVTRGFIFAGGEGPGSVLEGLTIVNGIAENGGAVFCSTGTSPRLVDCTFASNQAAQRGGGLCCWDGAAPTVIRCTFEGDTAQTGGGVSCLASATPEFEDCSFLANFAQSGGALYCEAGGEPTFSFSTFAENRAAVSGGAGYSAADAQPTFGHCTLVANGAPSGGGIHSLSALAALDHTIIAFSSSGGAFAGTGATFSCSDLYGNTGGDWTGAIAGQVGMRGNLSLDPLFCDLPGGDYHIWNYSPCNQVTCGLIGAWPVGCVNPQGVEPLAAPAGNGPPEIFLAAGPPNPSTGPTRIAYRFGGAAKAVAVRLAIYDVSGRLVRELVDGPLAPGSYETLWTGFDQQGHRVGSGVYLCRLQVDGQRRVERLLRIR
jgi:hypothetical protein